MTKKTASLALAVLLLAVLLIPTSAVQAEPDVVYIFFFNPGPHTVTTDDTVALFFGWAACTPGLVRSFTRVANFQTIVEVSPEPFPEPLLAPDDVRDLWWPIQPFSLAGCVNPDKAASAYWVYEWGQLPAGDYQLHNRAWLDHLFPDGLDYDGDGHPDPGLWDGELTMTIHVTAAP